MGQQFLPMFALAATSRYMAPELRDHEFNLLMVAGMPIPTTVVLTNPFMLRDEWGWWPGNVEIMDFACPATGLSLMLGKGWYPDIYDPTGSSTWTYRIVGVCYDSLGQPVSGARCRLFVAANDRPGAETLSSPAGEYGFGVPDNTTAYYVQAIRDAPAIGGITARTLTGT
mgnify:CR=1 FL=1